ncbi:hypothetical protein [Sphingomonas sp. SRS2]|uniref:hypothetical protein n=1 Tax=Sphingomonas sp. SRS2 TaxID=133190 RepID=UPI0006184B96|nr:hypothetical protein [Sphingomonas sp. SRS2]KKC25319.1 hypothetical protein WP12_14810 [Sphingomonas sp. SRS2]
MIAGFALLMTAGVAQPEAICPIYRGRYILGFETSYLVPSHGQYKRQKIWIESSNELAKYFEAMPNRHSVWKRADVRIKGCVKAGRFGPLGAYKFSIGAIDVIGFAEKS